MAVFCRYYFLHIIYNLTGFVIVWQNTPCTVCYLAMDCLPHWCCWTMLPDGVIQHNFSQKWCHLHACVHGRRKEFFQGGATSRFFQKFFYGAAKNGEIWFLPLEITKTAFLADILKFLPLFGHPYACV